MAGAGCTVAEEASGADALIWCTPVLDGLGDVLDAAPRVRWVQLPYAGIEGFLGFIAAHPTVTWTCAKGIYGASVAELALGALIGGLRRLDRYAVIRSWRPLPQRTLLGANVVIFGAGGIGKALVAMLQPFGCEVTVVRRGTAAVDGAAVVQAGPACDEAVARADAVVLALPLTPPSTGLVDAAFLRRMRPSAWLVNVARGRHVVTADLLEALRTGEIAGAVLDVTDPEPLGADHPLWQLDNCLVTPHVANTSELGDPELVRLVAENSRRFAAGEPLEGLVDPDLGY